MSKTPTKLRSAVGTAAGGSSVAGVGEFFKPLPSEHPFYAKIGKVIAGWAAIEHWFDEMIFNLCQNLPQPEISCLTGQLSGLASRVKVITSLCELRGLDPSLAKEIVSLSEKKLNGLSQNRNRIVHDAWYLSGADKVAQSRSQLYRKEQYGFKEITDKDLDKLEADISRCLEKLQDLRTTLWNALNNRSSPQPDPAGGMAVEDLNASNDE